MENDCHGCSSTSSSNACLPVNQIWACKPFSLLMSFHAALHEGAQKGCED